MINIIMNKLTLLLNCAYFGFINQTFAFLRRIFFCL